jgi:hypothetical protein
VDKRCEFFEQCPITKYFGQASWTMIAQRYCLEGHQDECARRKLRLKGQQVPVHLLPWENVPE